MATFRLSYTDALVEVRQRLLSVKSGSTDPGVADDTAIGRRLNLKLIEWMSWYQNLMPGYGTSRATLTATSSDSFVALPTDFRSAFQLYKVLSTNHLIPVIMISSRDEAAYQWSTPALFPDPTTPSRVRAYIEGGNLRFAVASSSDTSYVGTYQMRYYPYPTTWAGSANSELPPELDPILINDTALSLSEDGAEPTAMLTLQNAQSALLKKAYALFSKQDRIVNKRIKDVARLGAHSRFFGR